MKVIEIIQRIQSLYSKGVQSDSSRLTPRHIYNKMLTVRTKLLSEKAKKKQKISDWNYQVLQCIEMIDVPKFDYPITPIEKCKVRRSKYKIPRVLTDYNGNMIDYVMTIDTYEKFDYTNRNEMLYVMGNKYTSNKKRYLIEDGYLYAYGRNVPYMVRMRAIFEDPIQAYQFKDLCENSKKDACGLDIFEMDFPMDGDQMDILIEFAVQELIVLFSQNQEDLTNDNMDTQRIQPK